MNSRSDLKRFKYPGPVLRVIGTLKAQVVSYAGICCHHRNQFLTVYHFANVACFWPRQWKIWANRSFSFSYTTYTCLLYVLLLWGELIVWCRIRIIVHIWWCSDLSTWKYQFSYDHWCQATLSSVSTWMGDCSSVVWVLPLTLNVG